MKNGLIIAFVGTLLLLPAPSAAQAEAVSVSLSSGRRLTANVSSRTNKDWLVLENQSSSTRLIRRVRWSDIRSASLAGHSHSAKTLRLALLERSPQTARPRVRLRFELPNLSRPMAEMARQALGWK